LSVEDLRALVGSLGETLFRYSRGKDERPVRLSRQRKSLSSEHTYDRDLETLEAMDAELDRLATQVAAGLERRELSAATVTVKARYSDFETVSRSRTFAAPLRSGAELGHWSKILLRRTEAGRRPVRLLGVGASGLVRGRARQLRLFSESLSPASEAGG
jgi:DNA polymerase-4